MTFNFSINAPPTTRWFPILSRTMLITAWSMLTLASACRNNSFGSGIRHPPTQSPSLSILHITEIYVAVPSDNASHAFIELHNTGTDDIDLTGHKVCSTYQCVDLTGTIPAGQRWVINDAEMMAALHLSPNAGEVAVVSGTGDAREMRAYRIYGASPGILGSSLIYEAIADQVLSRSGFLALPFSMPTGVAMAFEITGNGCAQPSPDSVATIDVSLCPAPVQFAAPSLYLSEIGFADPATTAETTSSTLTGASWIELANLTASMLPLHGVRLCIGINCFGLPASTSIPANGWVAMYLARTAPTDAATIPANTIYLPHVPAMTSAQEISLLAPGTGATFDTPHFLSYVRYGTDAPYANAAGAVAAARWFATTDAATIPSDLPTHSLCAIDPIPPVLAGAWRVCDPTPGAANSAAP